MTDRPIPDDVRAAMALEARLAARYAGVPLAQARDMRRADAMAVWAAGAPTPDRTETHQIAAAGREIAVRLHRPQGDGPGAAILWAHGGGWMFGSVDGDAHLHGCLSVRPGLVSAGVTYRLAPEHPFPAAVEDVAAAFLWLQTNAGGLGLDPAQIAIGGASAGANLAVAACLTLRDEGHPLPAAMALFYGVFGDDFDTPSYRAFGAGQHGLSRAGMMQFFAAYAGGSPLADPRIAVLGADLAGLPPAWIAAAGLDVLRDDQHRFAAALRDHGVPCAIQEYPTLPHGFASRAGHMRDAAVALADCRAFLIRALAPSGDDRP